MIKASCSALWKTAVAAACIAFSFGRLDYCLIAIGIGVLVYAIKEAGGPAKKGFKPYSQIRGKIQN